MKESSTFQIVELSLGIVLLAQKQIYEYRIKYNLPEHPLDKEGYQSIGCAPCTRKFDINDERNARWFGQNKTECGLHKDLIK